MPTITSVNFDQDKYRTSISKPADADLIGTVTIELKEAPIGQPNFTVGANNVAVNDSLHPQRVASVTRVWGPSKYTVTF